MKMHFLEDGKYFSVDFHYNENITVLDAGFYHSNVMYVLYNHNEKPESGVYMISKTLNPSTPSSVIDCREDFVQKVILCPEDNPDILDGRIIVDKLLNSLTVTGMDCIRRYHIENVNGKYKANFLIQKTLENSIDHVPLNRESLVSWEFDEETNEAKIGFYRATDTKCLYHWIFEKSGLTNDFNITDLNELSELLI